MAEGKQEGMREASFAKGGYQGSNGKNVLLSANIKP